MIVRDLTQPTALCGGGWYGNSAGGCPFPEGSNKLAEGGAIKSVNVLLVGD